MFRVAELGLKVRVQEVVLNYRDPRKHIHKASDRDIPSKAEYNEAQQARDILANLRMLISFSVPAMIV